MKSMLEKIDFEDDDEKKVKKNKFINKFLTICQI